MILGLGKKQPATFKTRVATFWDWYDDVAERLFETIERGECATLAEEVGGFMSNTLPHLSWVFGPGENGGHSFTVTGEGYVPRQLLAEYWLECAPEIPKWTFHSSRQPAAAEDLKDFCIAVGEGDRVDTESFLLSTSVDDESEVIDLIAWHPVYGNVDEEHHLQILFLLLDEALGEFGTQTWIGEIKVQPIESSEKIVTLSELPEFIRQVNAYHQWEKLPPLQSFSLYEVGEHRETPRGDTIVGSTVIPNEIFELIDSDGKLEEDPLQDTGAEFVYLAIDSELFPEGQQSEVRGNIEDALDDALQEHASGRTLGGAFGIDETYIDLLLLDGDESRKVVRDMLDSLQLTHRSRIENFT